MLSFTQKINYLESCLTKPIENYADSFKEDIVMFIDDFNDQNKLLFFLNKFNSTKEIDEWLQNLCSRIILRFDSESEQINDFIYDYIQNN